MDIVDPVKRSRMMSGIKSKGTAPELLVRQSLHGKGLRFRLHSSGLPGHPDLVFSKHRVCVFVHGCFWHGHACKIFKMPSTRTAFWSAKIVANQARDARHIVQLLKLGWRVAVVWECSLRNRLKVDEVLADLHDWIVGINADDESPFEQF